MNVYEVTFYYKDDVPIQNGIHHVSAESEDQLHDLLKERGEKQTILFPGNWDRYELCLLHKSI